MQRQSVRGDLEEFGVITFKGNQLSRKDLKNFIKKHGGAFDIIIDDGAHMPDAIQISLGTLFPYLKPRGFYIIEDMTCTEDRLLKIEEVNAYIKKDLDIPHKRDYGPEKALNSWLKDRTWLSTQLSDDEKQYLIDNIHTVQMFEDGEISFPQLKALAVLRKI